MYGYPWDLPIPAPEPERVDPRTVKCKRCKSVGHWFSTKNEQGKSTCKLCGNEQAL